MNAKGKYDIVDFLTDIWKYFKYLYNVAVGKLAPHITTEVDCESLFSQNGHISQTNNSRTTAETLKYWLSQSIELTIYIVVQYK